MYVLRQCQNVRDQHQPAPPSCDFGIIYKSSDLLNRRSHSALSVHRNSITTVATGSDCKFPRISGQNEQDTLSNIVNMFMQLHAATV